MRNRSVPPSTVIPTLAYPDVAAAADWLCAAFGFRVRLRIGGHRVQLVLGDGAVVVTQLPPGAVVPALPTHGVLVQVPDVDAHHARAVAAGATIREAPTTYPYGERQYGAMDPAGHAWTFGQSVADVDPASWGATDVHLEPGAPGEDRAS